MTSQEDQLYSILEDYPFSAQALSYPVGQFGMLLPAAWTDTHTHRETSKGMQDSIMDGPAKLNTIHG